MDIIDQMIAVRKSRGISQQKLADMTGILQPVIARVESRRSIPTIAFMEKILVALDLELTIIDAFSVPSEIKKITKDLPRQRINIGRSGDKVYILGDKYLLKISANKESLRLEKDKNEWLSKHISGPQTVKYIQDKQYDYYLRTYIPGHTLIEKQYLTNPERLIAILKNVIGVLRSLDKCACPYVSSDNEGIDFVHGDLCLPNIVVDDNDNFMGFLDVSNSGLGDKQYDYCWLLWSFEYNLKTNQYNELLLKELNINIDSKDYMRYVITKMIGESKANK